MPPKHRPQAGPASGPESTPPLSEPPQAPPDPPEILAAVRRVQQGDDQAFAAIQRHYGRPLKQFFLNRGLPEDLAQDLYQETLLKAWRRIRQYRHDGPFGAWLQRIGENQWKNEWRARRTRKREVALVSLESTPEAGQRTTDRPIFGEPPPSPETRATRSDEVRRMVRALAALPPGRRRVLELHYAGELTHAEVARILGVKIGTVQSQVFTGREQLRRMLGSEDGGGDDGR